MCELPRIEKKVLLVESLHDADNEKDFWLSKNAQERMAAIELNRRMVYGEHDATSRLQRCFEIDDLKKNENASGRHEDFADLEHLQ